jgi:hypothetical protein
MEYEVDLEATSALRKSKLEQQDKGTDAKGFARAFDAQRGQRS